MYKLKSNSGTAYDKFDTIPPESAISQTADTIPAPRDDESDYPFSLRDSDLKFFELDLNITIDVEDD